ncbi:MAG TPA: kelch repeat-containing protein, partial [Terriglobales bacterium]|nr:kelch repeat-containing protein [Terriglobales bacterium]
NGFCPTGSMSTARDVGTEVLLPSGKVLLAGGDNNSSTALNAAELYDPITGTVSSTGNLVAGRATQASVLLLNGKVLLIGGLDSAGNPLASAELYDPTAGTFTATGSMAQARARVSAVLLADGRVLVSGGVGVSGELSSCEIYDPATGTFSATGSLNVARGRHTMTLLANGKVLVAGGRTFSGAPVTVFASAEIFDPNANGGVGAFTVTANMNSPRDEARAVLLSNGNVLIAGGFVSYQTGLSSATADIFSPAANSFTLSASNMSVARAHPTATPLPDGTILVAGGVPDTGATTPSTTSADIFNPMTGTFAPTGAMSAQREYATAVILPNGYALVSGGDDGVTTASTQEIYYSTSTFGPMVITTTTPGQTGTTSYTNPTAFGGAASSLSTIGFNGILNGATNLDFNPLLLSGVSFFTPQPSTFVNVTKSTFYTPTYPAYPADFIVNSANSNPSNQLVITLPAPTYAVGLTYGALGFKGTSSGNITLSNGYVLPFAAGSLPTAGQTQFAGFTSGTPFTALTYTVNSDDWVLLNLQLGTANVTLTNAIQNSPYTQVLLEQGGVGGLTWSVTGGGLPPGISLSAGGILHGTPTATGLYNFTVSVTDSSSPQKVAAAVNFTLTVIQQLVVTTTTLPNGTEGVPYSAPINTSGGTPQIFFSVTQANFPPGLTITQPAVSSTSDTLAGTPTLAGVYNFTEFVADSGNPQQTASQAYTVTIAPQPPTNLIASPQAPTIVTLTWTPSNSGDVASYKVYMGTTNGGPYPTTINVGNTNTFVVTGLTSGATYYFVVTAASASGVESPFSNQATATTP